MLEFATKRQLRLELAAVKAKLAEREQQLIEAYSENVNTHARHARQVLALRARLDRTLRVCARCRVAAEEPSVVFLSGRLPAAQERR